MKLNADEKRILEDFLLESEDYSDYKDIKQMAETFSTLVSKNKREEFFNLLISEWEIKAIESFT